MHGEGASEGTEPGVLPVWRPERHAQRVAARCGFESFEGSAGGNKSDGVLGCGGFVRIIYGGLRHAGQTAVGPPVQTPRDVMPDGENWDRECREDDAARTS